MDKNKSIDGLTPRRPSRGTSATIKKSAKTNPRSTSVKPASKKSTAKTKVIPVTDAPKLPKTQPPKKAQSTNVTEEFLKPVQTFNFDEKSGELKAAKDPGQTPDTSSTPKKRRFGKKNKKPTSKKRRIIKRIIIGFVSLLILLLIIFIIWGNDILAKITGGQGNVFDLLFADETYEPLKTDENGRTNILAFGTSGYDMEGTEGDGTHDGAQLTDSIMVISLNQESGDVAMLSLPRDLKVSSTCTSTGKINEVYWCNNMDNNDEKAGAEALTTEVGSILGVDFQYYAHLNWGSLVQIVDTLGGITVTLDEDIEDYYYTKAVFEAGQPYTIDGGQALGLARARHGTASGDFSRGASQQKILIGIKDKISEKSLSVADLIGLANTLGDNLRTNFSVTELKTVAHLASDLDLNNIRQVSLIEPDNYMATAEIYGVSYVIPASGVGNYGAIQNYVAKMFSNDPRNYEDASILVLNGTGTPGVASTEEASLTSDGYQNISVDNAPTTDYTDKYTLYALNDNAPGTKKLLEEKYNTTAKSATELPAGIPATYDFVLIVGSQPEEAQS